MSRFASLTPRSGLVLQRCACGRQGPAPCPRCAKQESRRISGPGPRSAEAPPVVHEVLREPGQPLDAATRHSMESRFGHDFSNVRVHSDSRAAASARAVQARAYTVGRHIAFAAPPRFSSAGSEALLAHELTHVIQQRGAEPRGDVIRIADPGTEMEREAERASRVRPDAAQVGPASAIGPLVMRQPDTANKDGASKDHPRIFTYRRANFDDRFDGEVDAANHRVVLIMRLNIEDWGKPEGKEERITKFRAKAKALIEQTWSGIYALQSVCQGQTEKFEARLRVEMTASNPHHTVRLWEKSSNVRSKSTDWQQGDENARARTTPVLLDPKKPPSKSNMKEMTFYQVPAVHEFGHLMGLQHIACAGDDDRCYGVTAEQKMDIMGYGSVVSPRDYAPFVRIMTRYGRDTLHPECNKWRLVSPG